MTPDPRSSRVWWVRQADSFPPRPFCARRLRPATDEADEGSEDAAGTGVGPSGETRRVVARSVVRVCGVAVLVLAIFVVLSSFGRLPSTRPVEVPSMADSGLASDLPPQILGLEVQRSGTRDPWEDPDGVGVRPRGNRYDDAQWVSARLDPPGYCYLIALDPDGRLRLADPLEPDVSPIRRSEIRYMADSDANRRASYARGAGLQAWLLVAARHPLPPFADWHPARPLRWRSVQAEGVWRFDGRQVEALHSGRWRVLERMSHSPRPFAELCASLIDIPDIDAVEVLAYPVKPPDD